VQQRFAGGGYTSVALLQDSLSFLDSCVASSAQYHFPDERGELRLRIGLFP